MHDWFSSERTLRTTGISGGSPRFPRCADLTRLVDKRVNTLPSIWRRRIVVPILSLLKQGITPEKLAQTLGAGFICSMFPLLGTTSVLNFLIGVRLRLNHPLMQTMNQLLAPVHLVMIVLYVRLGEWIWRAHDDPFRISDFMDALRDASWREFLDQFGWAALHSITAWALTAPIFFAVIYFPFRHLFHVIAERRRNLSGPISE